MKIKNERGELMLEAAYCILVCIIVLMLLLSLGFFLYQKTMFHIAANEIAEEVVQTYKLKNVSDSSEIKASDISGIGKYRYLLFSDSFQRKNEEKAKKLVETRVPQTSLAKSEGTFEVSVETVIDDIGRRHFEVNVSKRYSFLMGDLLGFLGQQGEQTLETTVYVESVDVLSYVNTVKFTKYGFKKVGSNVGVLKIVDSAISLLHSVFS